MTLFSKDLEDKVKTLCFEFVPSEINAQSFSNRNCFKKYICSQMCAVSHLLLAPSSPVPKSGVVMVQQCRFKAGILPPLKILPPCYGERVPQKGGEAS